MNLQQLEYLVALDNFRHFSTAADFCHVSQPNLTTQIKRLEEEVGVRVFDRETKPVQPTPLGEQVVARARRILREVAELREFVKEERESTKGVFSVGIIPTIAPYLLPLFLPDFVRKNPKTTLKIKEMQTDEILSELQKGTLDIGILVTPLKEKNIREIPLYLEPFLLYLPQGHPLTRRKHIRPSTLDPNQVLVLNEGHCFRNQALAICERKQTYNNFGFEYQSGSIESLIRLVDREVGYTLVPELAVNTGEMPASERVRRFDEPEPVREISIVVENGFAKETLVRALGDSVLGVVPESFRKSANYVKVDWK